MTYRELLDMLESNNKPIIVRFTDRRTFSTSFPPSGMVAELTSIEPFVSLYMFHGEPKSWAEVTEDMIEKLPAYCRKIYMCKFGFNFRRFCATNMGFDKFDAYHNSWLEDNVDGQGRYEFRPGFATKESLFLDDEVDIFDIVSESEAGGVSYDEAKSATSKNHDILAEFIHHVEDTIKSLDKNDVHYPEYARHLLMVKKNLDTL